MRGERIPLPLERNPFVVLVRCTEATTNGTENTPQPYAAIHFVDKRHTDRNIEKVA